MKLLISQEIEQISGATEDDANALAVGILVGAGAGFLVGGPVGAVIGAADVGIHFLLISHYW